MRRDFIQTTPRAPADAATAPQIFVCIKGEKTEMKSLKLISAMLSCVMAAGVLAGCSGSTSSAAPSDAADTTAATAAPTATPAPAEEQTAEQSTGMSVSALPDHYNDSSVTGTDWDAWTPSGRALPPTSPRFP